MGTSAEKLRAPPSVPSVPSVLSVPLLARCFRSSADERGMPDGIGAFSEEFPTVPTPHSSRSQCVRCARNSSLNGSKSSFRSMPYLSIDPMNRYILDRLWPIRQYLKIFASFRQCSSASQNCSVEVLSGAWRIAINSAFFSRRYRSRNSGTIFENVFQSDSMGIGQSYCLWISRYGLRSR